MKITDRRSSIVFAEGQGPAPRSQELTREIATVARDVTISTFGGVMSPDDDTLATRGGGNSYKIYDQIERDCRAFAVLQKRQLAVVSREWNVVPGGDAPIDQEAADEVSRQLGNMNFDLFCKNLLDATLKGFAVGEIMWEAHGNRLVATQVKPRNQRRFNFMEDGSLRLKTRENPSPGMELPERKFIVHRFGAKDDNPYGLGLGTRLFWPVWFKRQGITFWLVFCDKFGSPTTVGKYPNGTSKADQDKLLAACRAISQEAGVIIPEGMMVEFLEAARSGQVTTYESLAHYMDDQVSEAVLGETGSTNQSGGGGSRARDQVGNECRIEIAKADSDLLCATINETLVRWITDYNFPGSAYPKVWRIFKEFEDLKAKAERDKILVKDLGLPVAKRYFYDTYCIPEPEPGDDLMVIPMTPSPVPPAGNPAASFSERDMTARLARLSDRSKGGADQESMTAAAESLAGDYKKLLGQRFEELLAMLEESGDLVTFQKHLSMLLKNDPAQAMVDVLTRSAFAANLLGRTNGKAK